MKFWQIIGQWVLPILSIISAVVCVCVLCNAAPRQLEFDYMGVIVAIFALLVTLLIGWQVFNAVEMRGVFNKVKKYKEELSKTNKEYEQKIISLEWLVSALHGGTFHREDFRNGTSYFLHCLDVVGCYIKSGANPNSAPFKYSLDELETTLNEIKDRKNNSEIILMGSNKDFVREWYQTALKIIDNDAKTKHLLGEIKERLNRLYEDYVILTKDVKIKPHKSTNPNQPK